jgi:hypothetical protein
VIARLDATWRRTKASNEVRSLLREYYPAFLEAFAGKTASNLAKGEARAVLAIAPTPAAATRGSTGGRMGSSPRAGLARRRRTLDP